MRKFVTLKAFANETEPLANTFGVMGITTSNSALGCYSRLGLANAFGVTRSEFQGSTKPTG